MERKSCESCYVVDSSRFIFDFLMATRLDLIICQTAGKKFALRRTSVIWSCQVHEMYAGAEGGSLLESILDATRNAQEDL